MRNVTILIGTVLALLAQAPITQPPLAKPTAHAQGPSLGIDGPERAHLYSWGLNDQSQIGDGTMTTRFGPVLTGATSPLADKQVSAVSVGLKFSCALAEGAAYCWGRNGFGELGLGAGYIGTVPQPKKLSGVFIGKQVTAISVGTQHACAVADGRAYCWGDNSQGQLGIGSKTNANKNKYSPTAVSVVGALANKTVTAITAGDKHTCAIADAKAYCWGANGDYQLGTGNDLEAVAPVPVSTTGVLGGKAITAIAAGGSHTCALAAGLAYCWGLNGIGQLGNMTYETKTAPSAVSMPPYLTGMTVKALAVGESNSCFIAGKGAARNAYCWGYGAGWALGTNDDISRYAPFPVISNSYGAAPVSSITVDKFGGCLVAGGKAYCWGDVNKVGRLGVGVAAMSLGPVKVGIGLAYQNLTALSVSVNQDNSASIVRKAPSFSDVPANHPFLDDIRWLAATGLSTGYPNGTFGGSQTISRQAMAAFIYRYANPGASDPTCAPGPRIFTDVSTDHDFCGHIEWLVTAKIAPDTAHFNPGQPIDRRTMAAWLFRLHHRNVADQLCLGGAPLFPDVPADNSQCGNIEWLAKVGITTGYEDGLYHPNDPVTRQAMAAFFHRLSAFTSNQ